MDKFQEAEFFIKQDSKYLVENMVRTPKASASELWADEYMAYITSNAMRSKLRNTREKGRGGWWNPKECSIEMLKKMLVEHIEKGDMIDVMNFAGMIFVREQHEACTAKESK